MAVEKVNSSSGLPEAVVPIIDKEAVRDTLVRVSIVAIELLAIAIHSVETKLKLKSEQLVYQYKLAWNIQRVQNFGFGFFKDIFQLKEKFQRPTEIAES